MKKLLNDLFLPAVIVASLLLLMSASFYADELITNAYNNYAAVSNVSENHNKLTLIIDPGHGGADGGAVSASGGKESEINLAISLKAEQLAAFFGIDTILTRNSENIDYPPECVTIREMKVYDTQSRVELINNTDNAVVLSVHQNNFSDSSVSGAQVFYRSSNDSLQFSQNITTNFQKFISNVRSDSQISNSIYIFSHISCPAIMAECGFLSNVNENNLLLTEDYQLKIAASLISGYLNSEEQFYNTYFGGTNESQNSLLLY